MSAKVGKTKEEKKASKSQEKNEKYKIKKEKSRMLLRWGLKM